MTTASRALSCAALTTVALVSVVQPASAAGNAAQVTGQQAAPCQQPVLTLAEAARLLQVEADHLVAMAERQQVPGRLVGSDWRFGCEALMRWLAGEAGGETQAPIGDAPQARPADDVTLRGQRILLGRGDVVVDAGVFYSRTDELTLADVGGGIGLATRRREQLTTVVQGRVGLASETELAVGASYLGQVGSLSFGPRTLAEERQHEFLGANLGVRRTLMRESVRRPSVIATVDGYLPAGDRPYLVGVGIVLVKSLDPVAVFLAAGIVRAFDTDSSDPDTFARHSGTVSAGYALALNDTLATSLSVSGAFAGSFERPDDGRLSLPGRFNARVGVTAWVARGLYVEPSVTVSLSGPASGFTFGVTLPYTF